MPFYQTEFTIDGTIIHFENYRTLHVTKSSAREYSPDIELLVCNKVKYYWFYSGSGSNSIFFCDKDLTQEQLTE